MATLKSSRGLRDRIRIHLTEWGYDVQVYGQTVMRSTDYREANRFASSLRHALCQRERARTRGQ